MPELGGRDRRMSLFSELKRRNVFRLAAAYVVVGWLVTEVGTTLLQTFAAPDWVAKAIILIIALGFLPAVIFSWVYELTPEGIKKETHVDRDSSIVSDTGRKLDLITIAAVVIGVGFLGFSKFISTPSDTAAPAQAEQIEPHPELVTESITVTTDDASVAVLPFVNMSGNAENEYFSDGLTETLLHMLAQMPELKVAARTSSFAFKNKQGDVRGIAEALNVAHILEGSVQRAGDRVRITAQLIRADDGFHIWSENYDRTLNDIFAIQDEIAEHVGSALAESLLGADEKVSVVGIGTENIPAYESYLQALSLIAAGGHGDLREAETLLKDALSKDSGFIEAKVELSRVHMTAQSTGLISQDEAISQSIALLEQVVAEQPGNHRASGMLLLTRAFQQQQAGENTAALVEALPKLESQLERFPGDVDMHVLLASFQRSAGQYDKALRQLQIALDFDRLNPTIHHNLGAVYIETGQYERAVGSIEHSLSIEPNQPNAHADIGDAKARLGDAVGYVDGYYRASQVDSQDHELPAEIANYLYGFGLLEHGDQFLSKARAMSPESATTRKAELVRAYVADDLDRASEIAKGMIRDDVENRHIAYVIAVGRLSDIAIRQGMEAETLQFLQNNVAGFGDVRSMSVATKVKFSQGVAMDLWYPQLREAERRPSLEALMENFVALGYPAERLPYFHSTAFALVGDTEKAIDLLLRTSLSYPVSRFEYWEMFLSRPVMANVVKDPRVQEQMRRLQQEEDEARIALVEYLATVD